MILHWKPKKNRRQGFTLGEILVSFCILGLVMSGLMYGYVQINRMAEFSSMSLAAQSFASQGLEQARSVTWDYVRWPNTNANQFDPFWTPPSIGYTNLPPEVSYMDVPTTGALISVTNFVSVTSVCTNLNPQNPPLRQILCYCVWTFPLDGTVCTNTAVSLRAPDQ